ncbi:MAG: hypothetical protein EXS67_06425, partial [Candidatus Margulisbacteria bacterium]|nr:hypothetical protein [Candidatus Margulisiibacteriota bacterium]
MSNVGRSSVSQNSNLGVKADSPLATFQTGLTALARPGNKGDNGQTLALFFKGLKGKRQAIDAFKLMSQHLNATKDIKPHVHGKLAQILGDFVKECCPEGEQFDCIAELLNSLDTRVLGQLALIGMLQDPDQLMKLKKLKDDGKTSLFDEVSSQHKAPFGDLASKFCAMEPVLDAAGTPQFESDGKTKITTPSERSLGHAFLLKLNKFVSDAEKELKNDPDSEELQKNCAKRKQIAEHVVSVLFSPNGLKACLSVEFNDGVLQNQKPNLIQNDAHSAFSHLGLGANSPMAAHLTLQASQMSTIGEIDIVMKNLQVAKRLGQVLDEPGGPIEAFMTKALSLLTKEHYGQIVEVALLCGPLRQPAIFQHILTEASLSPSFSESRLKGIRDAIALRLSSVSQDTSDRLSLFDDNMTPIKKMVEGADPVSDIELAEKLAKKSSDWSSRTLDLSKKIESFCRKDTISKSAIYIGATVTALVQKHILDRVQFCENLQIPGNISTAELEDEKVRLETEKNSLSLSSLMAETPSIGNSPVIGASIEASLQTGILVMTRVKRKLTPLLTGSLKLIDRQLAMIEERLKARSAGPQSSDFRESDGAIAKRLSDHIEIVNAEVVALQSQTRGPKSLVPKQIVIYQGYLKGLEKLQDHLVNNSGDPLKLIGELKMSLLKMDPANGVVFKKTLLNHETINTFLDSIKKLVEKKIAENTTAVVGGGNLVPTTISGAVTRHQQKYVDKSKEVIRLLDAYRLQDSSVEVVDRAIVDVLGGMSKKRTDKNLAQKIKAAFFSQHQGFTILLLNPAEATQKIDKFVDDYKLSKKLFVSSVDAEIEAGLKIALKKLVVQFSATGRVDLQQDAMLEQLEKRCHYQNAVLTFPNADKCWASIAALDKQVPSSVGSSVAIQMFHNNLVMKGFTCDQTVGEWVSTGLSQADKAKLTTELTAFMLKLQPRLIKLVVSNETQNEVHALRDLLQALVPNSQFIAMLTGLLADYSKDKDYSESRPGLSKVGLVQSARLNVEEKTVHLNNIRTRYESLVRLHKQIKGLIALGKNPDAGQFGPDQMSQLEDALNALGKALRLPANPREGINELHPSDIPNSANQTHSVGWDTLDGLMETLDGFVGSSDGVAKPGIRLELALAKLLSGSLGPIFTSSDTSYKDSVASFEKSFGNPFNFEQIPTTEADVKAFNEIFELKAELDALKLQLSGKLERSQADLLATFKRKAKELDDLVVATTAKSNLVPASLDFVTLNSKFESFVNSTKGCDHLKAAMNASMAQFCIDKLDEVKAFLSVIPPDKKTLLSLRKEGILKSDLTFTDVFKARLEASINRSALSEQKVLLDKLQTFLNP